MASPNIFLVVMASEINHLLLANLDPVLTLMWPLLNGLQQDKSGIRPLLYRSCYPGFQKPSDPIRVHSLKSPNLYHVSAEAMGIAT